MKQMGLQVVRGDTGRVVALVGGVLDVEARFALDFVALHSAQKFSGLAREHGANYHLEGTAEGWLVVFAQGQALSKTVRRVVQCVV
jgi:hypothetical protein